MKVAVIEGHTRVVGEGQGFIGLPLRDEMCNERSLGEVHTMVTAWTPSTDELAAINAGANIHIRLYCLTMHPPIMVTVGRPPGIDVFNPNEPVFPKTGEPA